MRAVVQDDYGPLDEVLRVEEVEQPVVADGEVLVRIHAASIHIGDCYAMRGVPYMLRPMYGLRKPKARIPGTDIAGTVEQAGPGAKRLKAGDEVFGWCEGAFADLTSTTEDTLAQKPADFTFEQAAALGVSAFTALQGLRDHGHVEAGQQVLIVGASGGVGTFAVQIAKAFGAEVTGVCSTRNIEMVKSIGANHVIDYTAVDFTQGERRYDLIFDNVGSYSLSDTRRALAPKGSLLSNGAPVSGWIGGVDHVLKVMVSSMFVRQQSKPFVSQPNAADLATLKELAETGQITPVIDRTFPLAETAAAAQHVGERHTQGTTVISV